MKRITGVSPATLLLEALRKSFRSLPALKIAMSPWNTSTRTAASSRAAASASAMAPYIAEVIEFFFAARLKVSVQTPSSVCTRISLEVVAVMASFSPARRAFHSLK